MSLSRTPAIKANTHEKKTTGRPLTAARMRMVGTRVLCFPSGWGDWFGIWDHAFSKAGYTNKPNWDFPLHHRKALTLFRQSPVKEADTSDKLELNQGMDDSSPRQEPVWPRMWLTLSTSPPEELAHQRPKFSMHPEMCCVMRGPLAHIRGTQKQ